VIDATPYQPGEPPYGWRWSAHWRDEPYGECIRCKALTHTPGPDGQPWHAFCWMVPELPRPRLQYYFDGTLSAGLELFRRAIDQLEEDTVPLSYYQKVIASRERRRRR
jgi:hypothetical protein